MKVRKPDEIMRRMLRATKTFRRREDIAVTARGSMFVRCVLKLVRNSLLTFHILVFEVLTKQAVKMFTVRERSAEEVSW